MNRKLRVGRKMEKRFSQKITQDSENFSCDGYASTSLFGRSPGYVQNPIIRIPRAALNSFNLTGCGGKERMEIMNGRKQGGREGRMRRLFLVKGMKYVELFMSHTCERERCCLIPSTFSKCAENCSWSDNNQ